ncbi:MAG: peptidylprolyl isomerase [Candidatus Eisenbacteria bacterium]
MKRFPLLLVLSGTLLIGCGGSGKEGDVVARIGDHVITRADLERRLAEMPPNIQSQFEGEEGGEKLLEGMLDEEAFLLAALDMKLEENPEVKRRIESAERGVLIQSYYQREVLPYTQMTETDMIAYYEENLEEFTRPEESEVRQVVAATEAEALEARRRLLRGDSWEAVVAEHCVDIPTKTRAGRIGPIQKNASIIPLVGSSYELMMMIDSLTVGTISPVVKTGKGYHVITVEQRNPETEVAFEKVRETIRRNYSQRFAEKVRKEKVALLKEKFGVEIVPSALDAGVTGAKGEEERPAEKLFKLAQSSSDPLTRIKYYREIVVNYGDDSHVCEARFMIGFVYAEELHDFDLARATFQEVIDHGAECGDDLVKNATWMLENMGSEPPEFEDE